jgi:hypothetical protein
MTRSLGAAAALSFTLAASLAANAQAAAGLPDAPSSTIGGIHDKSALHAEGEREVKQEEKQRILAVVPNFHTVISGQGVALSPGQKTELAIHATLDPFNAVSSFLLAGVSEAMGTYRGYGWGPEGYFRRVGANALDLVDATALSEAIYPIVLRQDPRFFRQGTGSIGSRIKHALLSAYVCRGDNSRRQPNYSNMLGNLSGGAISNLYYPASDRGAGLTLENAAIVTLEGSLGNIGLEFSPDINSWWQKRTQKQQP